MMYKLKETLKHLILFLKWVVIIFVWVLFIAFWLVWLFFPYMILVYIFLPLIIIIFQVFQSMILRGYASANVILFGGRGDGKSLAQSWLIMKDNQTNTVKPMSNIDYGYNDVIDTHLFYESISPNASRNMINNTLKIVQKVGQYEGANYYWDDTNAYAPNTEDSYLKTYYKSLNLFVIIQRHLYNSYSVFNAQSLERMYKNLRELQLDGYIKALGVKGKKEHYVWNRLPIVRKYVRIKVRYYSQYQSALMGRLPFEKLGILNNAVGVAYTTTPEALKMQYEAENGVIKDFAIWYKKDQIRYDSREYHKHIFNSVSPTTAHAYVNKHWQPKQEKIKALAEKDLE